MSFLPPMLVSYRPLAKKTLLQMPLPMKMADVRPPQILVRGPKPQPQIDRGRPLLQITPLHEGFATHPFLAVRDRFHVHRAEPLLEPLEAPRDVRARGRRWGVARR